MFFARYWNGRGQTYQASRQGTELLFKLLLSVGAQEPQKWKALYYIYSVLTNISICVFLPISFVLSYLFEYHKMTIIVMLSSLQVAINVSGLPAKALALKMLLKHLRRSLDVLDILDKRCQRSDEKEKIQNCAMMGNRISLCHATLYWSYATVMVMTSIITGQPPYSLYIPNVDWRNSTLIFALQTFFEYMLMTGVCMYQAALDSYSVVYIYTIRTHVQILVERVRRLGTEANTSNDKHYEMLISCVKDHQDLLRLVDIISPVISVTIFIQFTITAAILGTTLLNILLFGDFSAQVASVVYMMAVLVQTTPCCYQATCLIDDSEQLSLAIFHCDWFDKDKRFRKILIYFMMRSQTPITLTDLKLFPITLNTSVAIVKFSFSLYTLIEGMDFGQNLKN